MRLQNLEDSDGETGSNSNPNVVLEDDLEREDLPSLPALEEETRQVIRELLSEQEVQISSNESSVKVVRAVTYEGHSIYKSTLVSQLNGNLYLSKDRLTRMKNSIYFNNADDYLAASSSTSSMLLCLGSDVGVYFKDMCGVGSTVRAAQKRSKGRPVAVNSGLTNRMFYIGRVQKIRVKVDSKWSICRHPIDLMKRAVQNGNKGTLSPTAMVYLHWFQQHVGRHKYRYIESDCLWIDVDAIISRVSLSYSPTTKIYTLDEVDADSLKEFVSNQK